MPGEVFISNKKTGLVLDMSKNIVTLQKFNREPSQLWDIKGFIIQSKHNGHVLDIEGPSIEGSAITTYPYHGGKSQQWYFNTDGTIGSGMGLVLGVRDNNLVPGAVLCACSNIGGENQKFEVRESLRVSPQALSSIKKGKVKNSVVRKTM